MACVAMLAPSLLFQDVLLEVGVRAMHGEPPFKGVPEPAVEFVLHVHARHLRWAGIENHCIAACG